MGTTSPDLLPRASTASARGGCARRSRPASGRRSAAVGCAPGARLPSTRALAADLGVTRRVVVEAYDQLAAEGYVIRPAGRGNRGERRAPAHRCGAGGGGGPAARRRLPAGTPRSRAVPPCGLGPGHPRGVRRSGGGRSWTAPTGAGCRRCAPRSRSTWGGFAASTRTRTGSWSARASGTPSTCWSGAAGHRFAVEEPGYPIPRNRLIRDGRRVDPVAVDGEGLVVDALRRTAARAVVVTPAHQSPTGVRDVSPPRRNALVALGR